MTTNQGWAATAGRDFATLPISEWKANDVQQLPLERLKGLQWSDVPNSETAEAIRTRLLLEWQKSKDVIEAAKADEMEMRKAVVTFASDPEKNKGTENIELGGGYGLKVVKKLNYNFVKNEDGKIDRRKINSVLDKIEDTVEGGKLIAERLVKWTPDLSLTEYNLLSADVKAVVDDILVVTDAAPTVEIKAPKGTK